MPKKNTQERIMPDIKWHTKRTGKGTISTANVTINVTTSTKNKKSQKLLSIIIRDNLYKQFDSDYIVFAPIKNRMYFKPAVSVEGYKLTVKNTSAYIQAVLADDEAEEYECFRGDYSLRHDDYFDLYFVDI